MELENLRQIGLIIFAFMAVSFVLAMILFIFVVRHLRHLDVPAGAGFAETLLYTPFLLVVFLDLLDLALDIFAAPFTWMILDRLGLRALRAFAAFEALLPFTQVIPTMTIAWFAARLFGSKIDILASTTPH